MLKPQCWVKRGNKSLYIGSRTFVKINQEAITGLPEGKLGKMAEDLTAACDWIKLLGSVGPNLKQLLSCLLEDKGVIPPDVPSVGWNADNWLPTASDDQSVLDGSLNTMSTSHVYY